MPRGQCQANKENQCSCNSKASAQNNGLISNYSTFCLSIFSVNCEGCQGYGMEHLPKQIFTQLYKPDPIFKNKVMLIFEEEKKLFLPHKKLIEKEYLHQGQPVQEQKKEFQKGTNFKKRYTEKILNFLDRCKEFRTHL